MWFRILPVFFVSLYSFGDFMRVSEVRTKRQIVPSTDDNLVIELFNNCTCVYHYQCDNDGLIITSGKGQIDQRLGKGRIKCAGGEFEGQYVCCKLKPGEGNKPPVTTEPPPTTDKITTAKANKTCGNPLPHVQVRIFQDEDEMAPVNGEFPWLVAIFKKGTGTPEWKFHASGSLIHPRVILTANHVIVSAMSNDLKVIVNGQIELGQIGDKPIEERNVKEIIKHPEYSSGVLYNDVSLLILEEPYNVTNISAINTLCLQRNISYENKRCLVAGWGRTPTTDGTIKVLKKVELPTLAHTKCEELLRKALIRNSFSFHESLMCAGGERGKDACKGDGGSPLICPTGIGNSMYQVGIVSWGVGCGKEDVPGVYTNVGFLYDWIVDRLKERKIQM